MPQRLHGREGAHVNVPSLTTIHNANLAIYSGGSIDTAQITSWTGLGTLDVRGETTSTDFSGLTNFDNHNVYVYQGADVTLGIQTYSRTDGHDPNVGWYRYFHVQDAGSTLSLPNLTEVVGRTEDSRGIVFEAHWGAQILMPSLNKSDSGMVYFDAMARAA